LELEVDDVPEDAQGLLRSKTDRLCVQCVTIYLLLRMAEDLGGGEPKSLISFYFSQLSKELPAFHEEVTELRRKVQVEAEDRAKELRLGPGGLDPLEVAQELPEDLRQCFILRDEELLKTVLEKMDPAEAERIMGRCVDSGLWIPGTTSEDSNDPSNEPSNKTSNETSNEPSNEPTEEPTNDLSCGTSNEPCYETSNESSNEPSNDTPN